MEKLFKYINSNDNNKISNFNRFELLKLLELLNSYKLQLRDEINLPKNKNITFGLEVETENASLSRIKNELTNLLDNFIYNMELFHLDNYECWNLVYDVSLVNGCELVSPILNDDINMWKELKKY